MQPPDSYQAPTTYPELQGRYGSHVKGVLESCRYEGNFEDLHSYVWVKLLEVKVLDRFEAMYANRQKIVTEQNFKNYLSRAVLNHYHNFCRTLLRRHPTASP